MIEQPRRTGVSLIEVMAAIIIAGTIAALSIQYLRPASETGKQRSCDLTRELLQSHAQRFTESTGQAPSPDLSQLETAGYHGAPLPTCPITGQSYRLGRSGIVSCPTHESTRAE